MKEFERLKKDGIRKWTVFESGRSLNLSETVKKVQKKGARWTVVKLFKSKVDGHKFK